MSVSTIIPEAIQMRRSHLLGLAAGVLAVAAALA
jgi:hypothetical protein